jgi:lysophospholipase L1-like esterase
MRKVSSAVVVVALLALSACSAPPAVVIPYEELVVPPSCPYAADVVQYNGDSFSTGWAYWSSIPGHTVFGTGQGGAMYLPIPGSVPSIGSRVRQWIDACGSPAAVVINGGYIDFAFERTPEQVEATVAELAAWLRDRAIPTVWVTVSPPAAGSPYAPTDPPRRSFNAWLRAGGPGWGVVADVVPALEAPPGSDQLNPAYWTWADLFTPDNHPTTEGYIAGAAAISAVVRTVLAPATPVPPGP